ncbi:MAG: hypothetical protein JWL77_991 [Chthonomonadaceae bacterium]|nr:hypothetical protein [Chthonomonadaceae bacterium]
MERVGSIALIVCQTPGRRHLRNGRFWKAIDRYSGRQADTNSRQKAPAGFPGPV